MDIDKLFKVPKLPTGGKRKLPDNPTPEMLKRMKMDTPSSSDPEPPPSNGVSRSNGKSRAATVEDEEEDEGDRNFAPGGDADYFAEEDDEGRFFGGGLTSEQKEILNIFDKSGEEGVQDDIEELNLPGIRRILLRFERAADKNQDQRSKYPDDPTKFIDSEADLDVAIKALLPLAQVPALAYPELVRSGAVTKLIGLLSHENADIVIDVVEVIHELTDEDVGNEAEEDEDEEEELLVDNLSRLNESEESDRQGVFHILGVFENILGFDPKLSTTLIAKTKFMDWLLDRIKSKTHEENRGYAAELLSIVLQNNRENRLQLGKKDGVETTLTVLSHFRRRDPVDADETEFMENVFDALCSALDEPEVKALFLKSEGVDLMVLMMKEKLQSKSRSIKTLDYAMSGPSGTETCIAFVEALGLKTLFAALMNKATKKGKATVAALSSEDTAHVLGIVSSLFSNLASDSPGRIRLLAKFVENNYEKVDKMLDIRDGAESRLKVIEAEIEAEKKALLADGEETGDEEDAWYLRRLDGGLFTLQTVDYILAWIAMEDDGIREHLAKMLIRKNKSLQSLVQTLQIYRDNVDEDTKPADSAMDGMESAPSQKEILQGLIAYLQGC